MGQLSLPTSGPVYVDANAVIYRGDRLISGSAMFVTNDAGFRRVPGLPVAVLSEVAAH